MLSSLAVKQRALKLGFDLAGIAPIGVWKDLEFSRRWVEKGFNGEMRYLENPERFDPHLVLPSAKSVISVGLVYNTSLPYSTEVGGTSVRSRESLRRNQKWSIEKAAESIVKVRSGIISEEVEKSEKLVVKLEYVSVRDLYGFYRFRYFVISFYDFDSQDRLFAAGQARYDPMSTEFGVIENTLDQVRKQVKVSN